MFCRRALFQADRHLARGGGPARAVLTRRRFFTTAAVAAPALVPVRAVRGVRSAQQENQTTLPAAGTSDGNRCAWWQHARFGLFIHWGVHAIPGRGEWIMYQEHIPFDQYAQLADQFRPRHFDPTAWLALARDAGAKYVVITTRHHDGYCLFDSRVSEFTSTKTAAQRDFIAEFADACHAAGLRMGFYYSLVDWRFPGVLPHGTIRPDRVYAAMVDQAHAQVRELLTNYGTVDILWFDMLQPSDPKLWRSAELSAMARTLQPNILINNRAGLAADFGTPENTIMADSRPWEACYTMNRSWACCPTDRNYKSPRELLRLLASCVADGGNLLLNTSPDADGVIPAEQVERLREVGQWLRVHGAAIYGGGSAPIGAPALGLATRVGEKVYLLLQRWPGTTLPLAWCGSVVRTARLLTTGQPARVEQRGDRVWLHGLPDDPPDPYLPVIELTFAGPPRPADPPYR